MSLQELWIHSGPTPVCDMTPEIINNSENFTQGLNQIEFSAFSFVLHNLKFWFLNKIENILSSKNRTLNYNFPLIYAQRENTANWLFIYFFFQWRGGLLLVDRFCWILQNNILKASFNRHMVSSKCPCVDYSFWIKFWGPRDQRKQKYLRVLSMFFPEADCLDYLCDQSF